MKKSGKKIIGFLLVFTMLLTMFSFQTKGVAADEYDNLRVKWANFILGGAYDSNDPNITPRISTIATNAQSSWDSMNKAANRTYLWSDLAGGESTTSSDISNSYSRLKTMTLAYAMNGSTLKGNSALLSDIISGLDWLYTNWYNESETQFNNWWDFQIGTPKILTDITAILYSNLTSQQITNYMNGVNKFMPDPYNCNGSASTGANRIDCAQAVAIRGIIVKDSAKIARARDALSNVLLYVTTGDGFYTDGSFIQHTDIAYTLSYGNVLIGGMADIIYILSGSTWAVTDPNISNFYKWIYDSYEPVIYKGAGMDMLRGRAISREASTDHSTGAGAIATIIKMAQFAPAADAANFKAMVKRWISEDIYLDFYSVAPIYVIPLAKAIMNDSSIVAKPDLVKHYEFNNMDRSVHLTQDFAFGISKNSKRVARYEMINNENLKGWYTGEGMTYLYNSDLSQFADDFWPTVNKYRLPGTTVDTRTLADSYGQTGSSNGWSGGTTLLGTYGASGMNLSGYGSTLVGKKSWFMFDDEIVCLGAGITSTDSRTIETIVEQRKINSSGNNALTVNGTAKSSNLGWSETMSSVNWAHLAGNTAGSDIGYYFPGSATIKGLRQAQSGTWNSINTGTATDVRTRNYLTMWFDHGTNPSNSSYSYVLLPNKTASQVNAYSTNPNIEILENSAQAQCVREKTLNITAANFWQNSTKTSDIFTSSTFASVLAKETTGTNPTLDVAISDPTMDTTGSIILEINKSAISVESIDSNITVLQTSPTIKLSVNVNGAKGKAFNAKFKLGIPTTTTTKIVSEADAYVRDGSTYGTTNYGSANVLYTKKDGTGYSREAFYKFNVSSITGTIKSAKVKIYTTYAGATAPANKAEKVTSNTWGETTINWNNKPTSTGTVLASWTPAANTWVTIDVTSDIIAAMNSDKMLSLRLYSGTLLGGTSDAGYASKEHGTVDYRPYIEIVTE